jgi:[ribosomal protein S5]-alanine N-acetyltransferase
MTNKIVVSKGIVASKRIYFRPISSNDIDNGWMDWVNDPVVNKFLDSSGKITRNSLIQYVNASIPPFVHMFAVHEICSGEYIGNARLSSIDYSKKEAAYGRLIGNKNCHGKGYGTEILILLSHFAFEVLRLKRIYTGVNNENIPSIKSNQRAGAVLDRVEKKKDQNGKECEISFFSINNSII